MRCRFFCVAAAVLNCLLAACSSAQSSSDPPAGQSVATAQSDDQAEHCSRLTCQP